MIKRCLLLQVFFAASILLSSGSRAEAEPRIALVIGNGKYNSTLDQLANPKSDADIVSKALKKLHFDVETVTDVNQIAMKKAIQRLGVRLKNAGKNATGLFYYAGHGLEDQGINYLIPVDAEIHSSADLDLVAVKASAAMDQMSDSPSARNIMILDSCRDTPFGRGIGGHRGFVVQYAPAGAFIGYSTAPGNTASDGLKGKNSPFAAAFAAEVMRQGPEINESYLSIRQRVVAATNNIQIAWDASALMDRFYFLPAATPAGAAAVVPAAIPAGSPVVVSQNIPEPSYDRTSAGIAIPSTGIAVRSVGVAEDNSQESQVLRWLDNASKSNLVTVVANRVKFHRGDRVRYSVASQVDGYISLFSIGPDKKVHVLHPASYDSGGTSVRAGERKTVPGTSEITPPFGTEVVIAVVSKNGLFSFAHTPLCSGKVEDICSGFYERLLEKRKSWALIDAQTHAGDWAFGAAHYVSER